MAKGSCVADRMAGGQVEGAEERAKESEEKSVAEGVAEGVGERVWERVEEKSRFEQPRRVVDGVETRARGRSERALSERGPGAWGVVHAIIGTAGYEFSDVLPASQQKGWVRFVNNTLYGYGVLTVDHESLHFGFVRSDGAGLLDEFTLHK